MPTIVCIAVAIALLVIVAVLVREVRLRRALERLLRSLFARFCVGVPGARRSDAAPGRDSGSESCP